VTIMEVGMEETLQNLLGHLIDRHTRIVPGFDNEIDGIFDDGLGDLAGRLVQDQGEVVLNKGTVMGPTGPKEYAHLSEERVRRIRSVPVVPDLILIMRIYDGLRRLTKSCSSGPDERFHEGLEGGDDKDCN